jgi:hypothetical protein
MATQTVVSLVGSQIQGIAGTAQDPETKLRNWDWATQWSLPKVETLGLFMPGVFGYKLDTPQGMPGFLREAYQGGAYWGGMGRDPVLDRFFDSGGQGQPPPYNFMRQTGGQNYAGITVVLIAVWAFVQSLRRKDSVFTGTQRKHIWFWSAVLFVSVVLAWGRFAPFDLYKHTLYALPYFSTIRNPAKFVLVFSLAVATVFAYGVHALSRSNLKNVPSGLSTRTTKGASPSQSANSPLRALSYVFGGIGFILMCNGLRALALGSVVGMFNVEIAVVFHTSFVFYWLGFMSHFFAKRWGNLCDFDRKWTLASLNTVAVGVFAWLIYAAEKPVLIRYLQKVGFGDEDMAGQIATFSIGQVGWFVLPFAAGAGLCLLIIARGFSGPRAKFGGFLLGALLLLDLVHADLPFVIHWDYREKYASNPIIDFLKDRPYEHRVVHLARPEGLRLPGYNVYFDDLYRIEWVQQLFPYYNIQSLDIVQRARVPANEAAYETAFRPRTQDDTGLVARRWQLTNARYFLGPAGFLDSLNEQLDPGRNRFRIIQHFDVVPKPGVAQLSGLEQMTVVPTADGSCALFEFAGALPRAKLYSNWQVNTNDDLTLQTLVSPTFDAWKTVLVAAPLPAAPDPNAARENSGTVEYKYYEPKNIRLEAQADTPTVLLLNDKFDPNWRVTVDGKPAELLRCNYIMRGVYLLPGRHTVQFQITMAHQLLFVTLAAIGVGLILGGVLMVAARRARTAAQP